MEYVSNNVVYMYVKHIYHSDVPHPHHRGHRSRNRRSIGPGQWRVHARVERFVEPALLLILRDGASHGYDLADSLAEMLPTERIDMGNLYRMLRALESEGIVESEWRDDLPGRNRRTYRLTKQGTSLLDTWAGALGSANETITAFLERYRDRRTA